MICTVCERGCRVPEGSFGACGIYCNTHGTILHIANVLHPEIFQFNVQAETAEFYHRFYNNEYMPDKINKSFGKPLSTWKLSIG